MAHLPKLRCRLPSNTLCRGVGRYELRVLAFERAQLVEQTVVLLVRNLGIVENVVAPIVVADLLAQRFGAPRNLGGHASNRCALAMRALCSRLGVASRFLSPVTCRCGAHQPS
ncbi:hypothetical protein HRbin41_00938 [bacterium HR41]|nr:hypothetical protein HRbin41_00938 [bacterium HR41]